MNHLYRYRKYRKKSVTSHFHIAFKFENSVWTSWMCVFLVYMFRSSPHQWKAQLQVSIHHQGSGFHFGKPHQWIQSVPHQPLWADWVKHNTHQSVKQTLSQGRDTVQCMEYMGSAKGSEERKMSWLYKYWAERVWHRVCVYITAGPTTTKCQPPQLPPIVC